MSNLPPISRIEPRYHDFAGIAVSALCAIHCAAVPLLLATAAASGSNWLYEEGLDWVFLVASIVIGSASLIPAYRRLHHRKACLGLFFAGILSILAGRLVPASVPDEPLVVFGAALIIYGHAANQYLCRSCRKCGTSTGATGTAA